MSHNHLNQQPAMVGVIYERLHDLFVRSFAHLKRQPQNVADVKAGKRPAVFVKHRTDLWRMHQRGADLDVMLAAIDELRADVESWKGEGCAVACVLLENISETEAQGAADVLVLVATKTDAEADLERAHDAQMQHVHRATRLGRSLAHRLGEKRRLRTVARCRLGLRPQAL